MLGSMRMSSPFDDVVYKAALDAQEKERRSNLEQEKIIIDVVKFLATLASGLIVSIAALLQTFKAHVLAKDWLGGSAAGFVLCVYGCVFFLMLTLAVKIYPHSINKGTKRMVIYGVFAVIAFGLLFGLGCLAVFVAKNISAL